MMDIQQFSVLAQADGGGGGGGALAGILSLVWLALVIGIIAGVWKTFEKAGKPGWAAIIPIYNFVVVLEISGRPIWWIILLFIPFVNIVIVVLIFIDFAARFGKTAGFGIGLALLGFIFFPILGFGDAKYQG